MSETPLTLIWVDFLGVLFEMEGGGGGAGKIIVNENISFAGYASGIQLTDCSKLFINRKNGNDVIVSFLKVFCFPC